MTLRGTALTWYCLVALAKQERRTQVAVLEQVLIDAATKAGIDVSKMSRL